jgi:hypothetical protein
VSLKLALLCVVGLALAAVVLFAVAREVGGPEAPTAAVSTTRPTLLAPRPALGPDEQRYIETLWPIHNQVERATVRVALGAAFYRLKDIDRVEFKSRLDQARGVYRGAEDQIKALVPPAALRPSHEGYLEGLHLFDASASEMLRMYDDGNEEHLVIGFPLSQQGSDRIREVGSMLFPDQYPPN